MKKIENKMVPIILTTLFLLPLSLSFLIVGFHSNVLILKPIHYALFLITFLLLSLLFTATYFAVTKKRNKKKKTWKFVTIIIILIIEWIGAVTSLFLLYGPYKGFRDWLIPTAMTTMTHQYYATWFYSAEEIQEVLNANQVIEIEEDTDLDLINFGENNDSEIYANAYEKEILEREEDDIYKIIPISASKYKGYLVAIYKPERVGVAVTKYLNNKGQYVTDMASDEQALVAINGGGFIDPGYSSNGGTPHGIVIKNGQLISNQEYNSTGGLIGFTKDNKMILGKMSANEAMNKGVRDAVTFGPFLIVNGKKSFIKGNGGWGTAPRTAIAQRQDGIVLFLVIDGRKLGLPGADMVDLTEILSNYGAYNAANLDGGTSSVLVFPFEVAKDYLTEEEQIRNCRKDYCYINDPIDGGGDHATRWIPTSFIVK